MRNRPTIRLKRPLRYAVLALIAVGLIFAGQYAQAKPSSSELKSKRKALQQVKQRIRHVQQNIKAAQKKQGHLTGKLRQAETRIAELKRKERDLSHKIHAQEQKIARTKDKRRGLQKALDKSRQALAAQARASYLMGRQSQLKLLLSQKNPALVERVMTYYDYLLHARAHAIAEIQTQTRALEKNQKRLSAQLGQMKQLDRRKKQTLAHIDDQQHARQRALAGLKHQLHGQHKKLTSLKKDRAGLKKLIGSLQKALTQTPVTPGRKHPFSKLKGKLPRPLHGKALARFGQSRQGGQMRWQGLWLSAAQGKAIHAVAYGRVVYVGWMPSYGLLVILDHGSGYYTLYAHAQTVTRQVGDGIKAGEEIATAGDTGGYRRTGVYFEIRKGKTPLDPAHWLRHR